MRYLRGLMVDCRLLVILWLWIFKIYCIKYIFHVKKGIEFAPQIRSGHPDRGVQDRRRRQGLPHCPRIRWHQVQIRNLRRIALLQELSQLHLPNTTRRQLPTQRRTATSTHRKRRATRHPQHTHTQSTRLKLKTTVLAQHRQVTTPPFSNLEKKVCFGHNVIFKHVDSEAYVSGTIKPSTGSNGAFTVQVSEKLSDSLVFKLLPFRSFEFLDMSIPFDSPILIKNLFNTGFMTYEKVGMGDSGNSRGTYI